ncbi:ERF family protein [uncultured phage MedDCM-OCT-S05-C113]|nr:ERF family protein [uncultured phage MedDCM-OCT-S05-C113]
MKQNNTITNLEQAPKGSKPTQNAKPIFKSLREAFIEFQKGKHVVEKDKTNPFHNNQYSSLDSIMTTCNESFRYGLGYHFESEITENGGMKIKGVMTFNGGNETREFSAPVYVKDKSNPQALGSGITYAKRYVLQTLFALRTDDFDDDGNLGSKSPAVSTGNIKTKKPLEENNSTEESENNPFK